MFDYANKIKEYRERQLLTQEDLAKELGVSVASITRWETGKYEPTMQMKKKLRQLFDTVGISLEIKTENGSRVKR